MHEDSVKGMTAYDILLNYLQLYVLVQGITKYSCVQGLRSSIMSNKNQRHLSRSMTTLSLADPF